MHLNTIAMYNIPTKTQRKKFCEMLTANLGDLDHEALRGIEQNCTWTMCKGGETLFRAGDPGDSAFFLVSGRLRVVDAGPTDSTDRKLIGEVLPGQTVGEISVFSRDNRTATVVAARDSILVRVDAATLLKWFLVYPQGLVNLASLIVKRATSERLNSRSAEHVKSIVIVPLTARIDKRFIKERLEAAMPNPANSVVISEADVHRGTWGTNSELNADQSFEAVNLWLDDQESVHEYVIYITNATDSPWTRRCLRRADRIVLFADSMDNQEPSEFERRAVGPTAQRLLAPTFLVLNHPASTKLPSGTAKWLDRRPWVDEHIHIRDGEEAHVSRLLRMITGNATGLVLGSGGARGLSHVGVIRALSDSNIAVDRVGGTSIGAVIAACVANGWDAKEISQNVRHAFGQNPTDVFDISLPPLLSLYSGNKLRRLLSEFIAESTGIEDLWVNYFCISCDITDSSQSVHTKGPLLSSILASAALPGVFPPVKLNDGLHVDGAFMNALPVDVMANFNPRKIIAVDLSRQGKRVLDFDTVPTSLEFFINKFRRGAKLRYRVPTVVSSIIQSSLLASGAKIAAVRKSVDLLFTPDVQKFELMDWTSCSELIDLGYRHAIDVLSATSPGSVSVTPEG